MMTIEVRYSQHNSLSFSALTLLVRYVACKIVLEMAYFVSGGR